MIRSAVTLVAVIGLLSAPPHSSATAPPPPPVHPAGVTVSGTIEGVVRMRAVPQRRAAARYPAGGAASRPIQDIPAVVFLRGPIGAPPAPGEAAMSQQDHRFDPSLLVVPVGTVVHFPNGDPFFHNVFSYSSAARFDLGRYPKGESKDVRFDEAGIVRVYCEVHESMRAAIVVVENGYWAVPDGDGRFTIPDVPPGTHTLVAWHTDRREQETEVAVPAAGTVRVELDL